MTMKDKFLSLSLIFRFSPFYWAGFVARRERAQQDLKVPYKVPHLTHLHLNTKDSHSTGTTLILYCNAVINFESNTVIEIDFNRVTDHASPGVACTKNLTKAI